MQIKCVCICITVYDVGNCIMGKCYKESGKYQEISYAGRLSEWVSEWVGFNGISTQFRSLAPSLTRK